MRGRGSRSQAPKGYHAPTNGEGDLDARCSERMNDVASPKTERPGVSGAWQLVREVIVTLAREDRARGGRGFGARALRSTIVSSIAGAFSGLIPAFVALGIAGVAKEASPALGPLAFAGRWLAGAPSWSWVLASLVLVATAVSVGFMASRAAASFSAEATA